MPDEKNTIQIEKEFGCLFLGLYGKKHTCIWVSPFVGLESTCGVVLCTPRLNGRLGGSRLGDCRCTSLGGLRSRAGAGVSAALVGSLDVVAGRHLYALITPAVQAPRAAKIRQRSLAL